MRQIEKKQNEYLSHIIQAQQTKLPADLDYFLRLIEKPLKRKIKIYVHSSFDADEILQKTLIKISENYMTYNPTISAPIEWAFNKFTYGIIRHYYRDVSIKKNRILELDDRDNNIDLGIADNENDNPLQIALKKEKYSTLHQAIFKLENEKQQDVVIIHHLGNVDLKHIASFMNEKYSTIRTWHDRAKAKLYELLKNYFEKGDKK